MLDFFKKGENNSYFLTYESLFWKFLGNLVQNVRNLRRNKIILLKMTYHDIYILNVV